ncbi:MAG TPA: type 1 glutamine amidotransferase [Nevskiaceae bacterium]|nr:type 1 glutamine amidotransferase [Nevskiaceae bacterium]
MKAVILQHVDFEGPGAIADWLNTQHAGLHFIHLGRGEGLPPPLEPDLAIVMGGPMSVNDTVALPWLLTERQWLAARVAADAPTLGVCLGAQLIAAATGARVGPGPHREIGWFDIASSAHADADAGDFRFPARLRAFHWHGETFGLPPGARRLASSAACHEQAFQLGRHVIGLQCHLEATPTTVRHMAGKGAEEAAAGGAWVQDAATLQDASAADYAGLRQTLDALLDYLVQPGAA